MRKLFSIFMCSSLCVFTAAGIARAETIVRYECSIVGPMSEEPLADRSDHILVSFQYSCFGVDGLLKGAVYTANYIAEGEGGRGTFLLSGGIHRAPGSLAVTQAAEGTGSAVVRDGKIVGSESSGKVVFKFASGYAN